MAHSGMVDALEPAAGPKPLRMLTGELVGRRDVPSQERDPCGQKRESGTAESPTLGLLDSQFFVMGYGSHRPIQKKLLELADRMSPLPQACRGLT